MEKSKTYRLRPELFEEEKSRLLRGFYFVFLMSVIAALLLASHGVEIVPGTQLVVALLVITVSVVFTICLAFWSIFRSLRLRKAAWHSFELTLTGDVIDRRLSDHDDFVVKRSEVVGFDETAGRGFFIKTANRHRYIYVPAALDGYDELKRQLASWQPFPPARTRDPIWRSPFFVGASCLAAWSVLWYSQSRQNVVLAGLVLLLFLVATFVGVLRSPRASRTVKRTSWIYLAVAALALVRIYVMLRPGE
jgi:drug/metabolite transporter (DMT)-like permease